MNFAKGSIYLPDINDLDKLKRGLEKVSFFLGLQKQGVFLQSTDVSKVVALDVPRPQNSWQRISGAELREWVQHAPDDSILPVWPGVDVLGKPFVFDLVQAPHLLIGGTTGSGKSICLHALILSLLWKFNPDQVQLCLIDPKKVEFTAYEGIPHLWNSNVIFEMGEAADLFQNLLTEMDERTDMLSRLGARDLTEALAKGRISMPRIIVFVEELADLFMQSKATEEPLVRLAQKARATGIHLVLATQRPDAETFSGLLRSNIPSRIALTVQKSSESKIIIDEVGADKLSGLGDMLLKLIGSKLIRIHGLHITFDDIAACTGFIRGKKL